MAHAAALPALTDDGFLKDVDAWNEGIAQRLAEIDGVQLDAAHWEVLHLLRRYYQEFDSSPAMRALVKYCRNNLGEDKSSSIYLLKLFPGSPAKIASRIAGLPKPANCL